MVTRRYDVVVLGVGAMGSAACLQLARRGVSVLGLEQFEIGHARGASHGESRLIRKAYFEHPAYVPLLERAYELWEGAQKDARRPLMHLNGLVIYGPDNDPLLEGVRLASRQYGVKVEELSAKAAAARFPAYKAPDGHVALLEPGAGYLEVEACVTAQATLAVKAGATIQAGVTVTGVEEGATHVTVETSEGAFEAGTVVVTAGPWAARLVPKLASKLSVHRVPLCWFEASAAYRAETGLPCFGFTLEDGFYYGLPRISARGVKAGFHKPGEPVADPTRLDRTLGETERARMERFVARCLPGVEAKVAHHVMCMYTMSPDEHFILDREGRVAYAAGFSGHGFKFASVVGEVMADLATAGATKHPIDFLRWRW